jgi:hypothetical protein
MPDDLMRATLATQNNGLAVVWISPNPNTSSGNFTHWQFQGMAIGDCLGDAMMKTIKDGQPATGDQQCWISILGDPTLRIF